MDTGLGLGARLCRMCWCPVRFCWVPCGSVGFRVVSAAAHDVLAVRGVPLSSLRFCWGPWSSGSSAAAQDGRVLKGSSSPSLVALHATTCLSSVPRTRSCGLCAFGLPDPDLVWLYAFRPLVSVRLARALSSDSDVTSLEFLPCSCPPVTGRYRKPRPPGSLSSCNGR